MIKIGEYGLIGQLKAADCNVTTDQAIKTLLGASPKWIVRRILAKNATLNLTTAAGGIYTGASKSGTTVVGSGQVFTTLSSSGKWLDLTLAAGVTSDILTVPTLYFSLTTPQGATALVDLLVYGEVLEF